MSVKKAIESYCEKQLKKSQAKRKKKNEKPEKALEKEVMLWLKQNKFTCNVVESKAVFSQKAQRYLNSQAIPGMADIVGNGPDGVAVFIELKAPGKLGTIRPAQYEFLMTKIESNCFAVCIDSVLLLERMVKMWAMLKTPETKQMFLKNSCPKPRLKVSKDLDFDE